MVSWPFPVIGLGLQTVCQFATDCATARKRSYCQPTQFCDSKRIPCRAICQSALTDHQTSLIETGDTETMRKLLLCAALLAAGAAQAQTSYTLADVATHATAADCWMVLNTTKVYNFTPFVSMHPGGNAMVPYCGKEGDAGFASVPHSSNAVALETTYLIGTLAAA